MAALPLVTLPPIHNPGANEANVDQYGMESLHVIAFASALVFTLIAVGLSIHLIYNHLDRYNRPSLQRHVYRILIMCPIYATCSVIGIGFPMYSIYLDVLRDSYEAYTIYSFVKYLIAVLGEEKEATMQLARKAQVEMLFPLNYVLDKPWTMGTEMIYKCKYGALQYVIVKPVCSVVVFISESFNFYGEGEWRFDRTYPYVSILSNTSQILAMYSLLMLFVAASEELQPWHPVPKFLSVKAVVFFTFWQGVLLQILFQLGILVSYDPEFTSQMLQVTLQNWLVCLEMCFIAWYHNHAFPVEEYEGVGEVEEEVEGGGSSSDKTKKSPRGGLWQNFQHGMAIDDMVHDVGGMAHLEGVRAEKKHVGIAELAKQAREKQRYDAQKAQDTGEHALYQGGDQETEAKSRWKSGVSKVYDRIRPPPTQ